MSFRGSGRPNLQSSCKTASIPPGRHIYCPLLRTCRWRQDWLLQRRSRCTVLRRQVAANEDVEYLESEVDPEYQFVEAEDYTDNGEDSVVYEEAEYIEALEAEPFVQPMVSKGNATLRSTAQVIHMYFLVCCGNMYALIPYCMHLLKRVKMQPRLDVQQTLMRSFFLTNFTHHSDEEGEDNLAKYQFPSQYSGYTVHVHLQVIVDSLAAKIRVMPCIGWRRSLLCNEARGIHPRR